MAANTMGQFRALCALLGHPKLPARLFVPEGLAAGAFLDNLATFELRAALSEAFAVAKASALEQALNAAGVPAAGSGT